jgi:hypothetical protein
MEHRLNHRHVHHCLLQGSTCCCMLFEPFKDVDMLINGTCMLMSSSQMWRILCEDPLAQLTKSSTILRPIGCPKNGGVSYSVFVVSICKYVSHITSDLWTDIGLPEGRNRDGILSTNNWTERAFKTFDQIFLGGRANKSFVFIYSFCQLAISDDNVP